MSPAGVGNAALLPITIVLVHRVWATVIISEFTLHALCIYISTLPIDTMFESPGRKPSASSGKKTSMKVGEYI